MQLDILYNLFFLKNKLAFKTSGNYEKQNRILQIRSS